MIEIYIWGVAIALAIEFVATLMDPSSKRAYEMAQENGRSLFLLVFSLVMMAGFSALWPLIGWFRIPQLLLFISSAHVRARSEKRMSEYMDKLDEINGRDN